MTQGRRTPHDAERRRALADAAAGWEPRRGDLALDTGCARVGVVVALPEDTGAAVYHLRPVGGGIDWSAPAVPGRLRAHPDAAGDGLTLDEAAMPPQRFDSETTVRQGLGDPAPSPCGTHHYDREHGVCAACHGPWPCSVALTVNSGDSTPPRTETEP